MACSKNERNMCECQVRKMYLNDVFCYAAQRSGAGAKHEMQHGNGNCLKTQISNHMSSISGSGCSFGYGRYTSMARSFSGSGPPDCPSEPGACILRSWGCGLACLACSLWDGFADLNGLFGAPLSPRMRDSFVSRLCDVCMG
jgi:hypothetical protein